MKCVVRVVVGVVLATVMSAFADLDAQAELEESLRCESAVRGRAADLSKEKPVVVPLRYRNALPGYEEFIRRHGWTTNQFIEGVICAITNNVKDDKWNDRWKRRTAGAAAMKLREIDNPTATNFFRQFNDTDSTTRLKSITIPAMFLRTNLEPEVMAYLRSLCFRTNVYCKAEYDVIRDMFSTLKTMSDELKPAATNRVAKYMYFAIHNETDTQGWHDQELSRFIPAYSNSFQRLSLMRYVSNSASNTWERSNAAQIVKQLSVIPTNQLNNISWIAEDVTGREK